MYDGNNNNNTGGSPDRRKNEEERMRLRRELAYANSPPRMTEVQKRTELLLQEWLDLQELLVEASDEEEQEELERRMEEVWRTREALNPDVHLGSNIGHNSSTYVGGTHSDSKYHSSSSSSYDTSSSSSSGGDIPGGPAEKTYYGITSTTVGLVGKQLPLFSIDAEGGTEGNPEGNEDGLTYEEDSYRRWTTWMLERDKRSRAAMTAKELRINDLLDEHHRLGKRLNELKKRKRMLLMQMQAGRGGHRSYDIASRMINDTESKMAEVLRQAAALRRGDNTAISTTTVDIGSDQKHPRSLVEGKGDGAGMQSNQEDDEEENKRYRTEEAEARRERLRAKQDKSVAKADLERRIWRLTRRQTDLMSMEERLHRNGASEHTLRKLQGFMDDVANQMYLAMEEMKALDADTVFVDAKITTGGECGQTLIGANGDDEEEDDDDRKLREYTEEYSRLDEKVRRLYQQYAYLIVMLNAHVYQKQPEDLAKQASLTFDQIGIFKDRLRELNELILELSQRLDRRGDDDDDGGDEFVGAKQHSDTSYSESDKAPSSIGPNVTMADNDDGGGGSGKGMQRNPTENPSRVPYKKPDFDALAHMESMRRIRSGLTGRSQALMQLNKEWFRLRRRAKELDRKRSALLDKRFLRLGKGHIYDMSERLMQDTIRQMDEVGAKILVLESMTDEEYDATHDIDISANVANIGPNLTEEGEEENMTTDDDDDDDDGGDDETLPLGTNQTVVAQNLAEMKDWIKAGYLEGLLDFSQEGYMKAGVEPMDHVLARTVVLHRDPTVFAFYKNDGAMSVSGYSANSEIPLEVTVFKDNNGSTYSKKEWHVRDSSVDVHDDTLAVVGEYHLQYPDGALMFAGKNMPFPLTDLKVALDFHPFEDDGKTMRRKVEFGERLVYAGRCPTKEPCYVYLVFELFRHLYGEDVVFVEGVARRIPHKTFPTLRSIAIIKEADGM